MTFLDTAISQSYFQNTIHSLSIQAFLRIDYADRNGSQWAFLQKLIPFPNEVKRFNLCRIRLHRDRIVIKAVVATESSGLTRVNKGFRLGFDFESKNYVLTMEEHRFSPPEDSIALQEREKLRRTRISKANRGNVPWNKGRKHSPETLQLIRERTRLAMQDPKVRMKLVTTGHNQSEETRIKIGVGVRIGWEKRREKLLLQETCLCDWQNLIAEAARGGHLGEEELQWDSYVILDERLEQDWKQSVEEREKMRKPKGSKRAPKSLEQRRKISEAIAAKWADPGYRNRVYSGLVKYHGTTEGVERKPRRNPVSPRVTRQIHPAKQIVSCIDSTIPKPESKNQTQRGRSRRDKAVYTDPSVGSKLEMLKNIRAQRTAAECQKREAITRVKVMIAKAETAAKALEEAAKKSPIAHASLIEARKLIAEAIQSITSIDQGHVDSQNVGNSTLSSESVTITDDEIAPQNSMASSKNNTNDPLDEKGNVQPSSFSCCSLVNGIDNRHQMRYGDHDLPPLLLDDTLKLSSFTEQLGGVEQNGGDHDVPPLLLDDTLKLSSFTEQLGGIEQNGGDHDVPPLLLDDTLKLSGFTEQLGGIEQNGVVNGVQSMKEGRPTKPAATTKKWVRGKLLEVTEGC